MEGDLRRLRGDRDKKSVPHCIVHACMNGLFFLTTELHRSFSLYITFTTLLQHSFSLYITFTTLLHHFYIICTSLLHHSFSSYVTFILCAICTSDPLPECAENGFSGCAGNASRPRNKLRPRSPFSGGTFHRVSTTRQRIGSLIGCHAPECITIHARKTHRSYSERFSGGKVCCFEAQAGKSRTGRFSGARNVTLW